MEKPDRKKFRREFGPRYAIKYAKAMRKYRKSLKTKPTAPPPAPKKKSPPAPPPAPKKDKPAQPSKPAAQSKPATNNTSAKQNREKAIRNFDTSVSGVRGTPLPSNPQLKSKPKRSNFPAGRDGQAKYAAALRNYNKRPAKPRRAALTMAQRRRARRSSR